MDATSVSSVSEQIHLSEITTAEEFRDLRNELTTLLRDDDRATVFQTWEFLFNAWRAAQTIAPLIVTVRSSGKLIACAPFGIRKKRIGPLTVNVLCFVSGRFAEYSDLVVHCDYDVPAMKALSAWFSENCKRWDLVRLTGLKEGSWLTTKMTFSNELRIRLKAVDVAPYLNMDPAWSSFADVVSRKKRKTLRREYRRLFDKHGATYGHTDINTPTAEVTTAIDELFRLHQKRMQQKAQAGHFGDIQVCLAFGDLIKDLIRVGRARLNHIEVEGRTVAIALTLHWSDVTAYYQGGMDPEFGALSPGTVLQCCIIDDTIARGGTEYDFLQGGEKYKYTWASGERVLYELQVRSSPYKSLAYIVTRNIRKRLAEFRFIRELYLRYLAHRER